MALSAPTTSVDVAQIAGNMAELDLTLWGMFMQADPVVKTVIIVLILASFWSWAIIFEKWIKFKLIKAKADSFEESFWNAEAIDSFYSTVQRKSSHPFSAVFCAAMEEWHCSNDRADSPKKQGKINISLQDRMAQIMSVARNRELDELESGLGFLATVGSSAPFIGLFGTVWGIMNSFQSIAMSKNTSIAVVAPGIAEALFATAIGLLAAIPAVIAYNKFSNELAKFAGRLEDFSIEFSALISRQTDIEK